MPTLLRCVSCGHGLSLASEARSHLVDQWLFYRSLTRPANRTLLGQNLSNEFFAARFDRDGEAEELIGVTPEE
jgi:hypothetical protein